jgi:glycine cleavage system regulatory protein
MLIRLCTYIDASHVAVAYISAHFLERLDRVLIRHGAELAQLSSMRRPVAESHQRHKQLDNSTKI